MTTMIKTVNLKLQHVDYYSIPNNIDSLPGERGPIFQMAAILCGALRKRSSLMKTISDWAQSKGHAVIAVNIQAANLCQ